jgi:hypothetical protein
MVRGLYQIDEQNAQAAKTKTAERCLRSHGGSGISVVTF